MTDQHALVRADASVEIGTGHVVRCRALADELVRRGWSVAFASRHPIDEVERSTRSDGFTSLRIPTDVAIDEEPEWLGSRLPSDRPMLVVDHYAIGSEWLDLARVWAGPIVAVDDLANRPLPVDLVLNQNLGVDAGTYAALVPDGARILVGPQFALVRPGFVAARERHRPRSGAIDRILVFLSGGDPSDVTRRAAVAADSVGVDVDVVVGTGYPGLAGLRTWVGGQPRVELHVATPAMAELMERADLAIGAPGSASWERCTVGLPSILVLLADNQAAPGRELSDLGAAVTLGWQDTIDAEMIRRAIEELRTAPERVRAMSDAACRITDGRGTERVAAEIESLIGDPVSDPKGW